MPSRRKNKARQLAATMGIEELTSFRVAKNIDRFAEVMNDSRKSVDMTDPVWTACFGSDLVVSQLTNKHRDATNLGTIVAWLPEDVELTTDCHDDSVAKFVKPYEARLLTKLVCLNFERHTCEDDEMMAAWDFYNNAISRDLVDELRECDIIKDQIGIGEDLPEDVEYTPASYQYVV